MRLLVFQHHPLEHPGVIRDFMAEDGVEWDAVELDEGESIPSLEGYDALVSMGGPMDTWMEDEHPWLKDEKVAIREAILDRGLPFLGICLGHQLLADALGGKVGPSTPEVGVLDIELTEAGRSDPLTSGNAPRFKALQWHSAAVLETPADTQVLASSPVCPYQAIKVGALAYGFQYHVEVTPQTVDDWATVPEYIEALKKTIGEAALPTFKDDVDINMTSFNEDARRLYKGFMALVAEKSRSPVPAA